MVSMKEQAIAYAHDNLARTLSEPSSSQTLTLIEGGLAEDRLRASSCEHVTTTPHDRARAERLSNHGLSLRCCFVAFAFFAALFMMWLASTSIADAALSSKTAAIRESTTFVRSGDGLLSIAAEHPVEGLTTEQTAQWIEERNGLEGITLQPGQQLIVPR